jgi:hypothetical protein
MNTKLKCVKCGSEDASPKWIEHEHIQMLEWKCGCGYSWTTSTEDQRIKEPAKETTAPLVGYSVSTGDPVRIKSGQDEAIWELDAVRKLAEELVQQKGKVWPIEGKIEILIQRAAVALDWCASQLAEQRNLTIKWQDEARQANIRMGKEHSEVVGLHEQLRIASKDAKLERNAYNELSVKHHDLVRHHESDHTMIQDQRKDISKMEKQV